MGTAINKTLGLLRGVGDAVMSLELQSRQSRVLCAESHQDTREFLGIWLGLAGYDVTPVDTIAACVEIASRRPFDLFLISDRFPDGSGFNLVEKIRSFDRHTPLLFYSAYAYQRDIKRGMRAGAQAYITKPSNPERLVETIRLLIRSDGGAKQASQQSR